MSFSVHNELNNILGLLEKGTLNTYNFDKLTISNKLNLFPSLINHLTKGHIGNGHKNFKMEYYYPLLEVIVNQINKSYSDNSLESQTDVINSKHKFDHFVADSLIPKINQTIKGQVLLSKLNQRIEILFGSNGKPGTLGDNNTIISHLRDTSRGGSYLAFIFWLSKTKEKTIENLTVQTKENIFISSIGNSDDRIYKYVLEKILKDDKLFFQKSTSSIREMFLSLGNSLVPQKYILKRIKLLSTYISLVPYFEHMMASFRMPKLLLELHKYYYAVPYNFDNLSTVIRNLIDYEIDENGNQSFEKVMKLRDILKTDDEKNLVNIILSTEHNYWDNSMKCNSQIEQIVCSNYNEICKQINWTNFLNSLTYNELNYHVLTILASNNLIAKYVDQNNCLKSSYWLSDNFHMLFFTRFLPVKYFGSNPDHILNKAIRVNKFLHILRLFAKKKSKNKIIQHKVKMFDLLKEIKTYSPNQSVPVLKKGSNVFQQQKQRFTNLPPRHLLPGEISAYDEFLIREKADGILINNLPVGIYPQVDLINNYQVKAEYIEDLDLYLVFDIDIPNTTITERYNMLRCAHSYTESTELKQISNFDQFIQSFREERELIKKFMKENQSESIKWYPKFACKYLKNNNNLHIDLINNVIIGSNEVILETIKSSEPFSCDGIIITPLNGDREIKIKPKSMMTIDLLFDGKKWVDRDLVDWSHIIVKPKTTKKENRIYRCYPDLDTLPEVKFTVGEFRYDKKNPNPNNIVDSIINMVKHDWVKDLDNYETFYYGESKKINSRNLIDTIKAQNDLLVQKINGLEPSVNKNWLDLGCGKGKLIPLIKQFNPKKYLGLDADVKQLIRALKFHDENQNVYQFSPCNLAGNWSNPTYKWVSINPNIKYDYVVANFSIMHFFTDEFWTQINEIVHEETKFLFNVVNVRSESKWSESESFLEVVDGLTKYKFEWTHDEVKTEPYIDQAQIQESLRKHGWKVLSSQDINSKYPLINMYKWLIIQKC